jgi:PPOX class probable F420-dependent enzyme
VTPDGQPQSTPIWFLWVPAGGDAQAAAEILVYGAHRARRNANLVANPRVTFHLDTNDGGRDVVVIEGRATMDADYAQVYDNPTYLAKYGESIARSLGGAHQMAETYDVPIRIRPTRIVAY